jgi:hypothetical protein
MPRSFVERGLWRRQAQPTRMVRVFILRRVDKDQQGVHNAQVCGSGRRCQGEPRSNFRGQEAVPKIYCSFHGRAGASPCGGRRGTWLPRGSGEGGGPLGTLAVQSRARAKPSSEQWG